MTLIELRDKINTILEETPSWANVDRIGIVTNTDDKTGLKTWSGQKISVPFVVMVKAWQHLNQ